MRLKEHTQCSPLATLRATADEAWHPPQLTYSRSEHHADCVARRHRRESMARANLAMVSEQLQTRPLIEHENQLSRAERVERASRGAAQQQSDLLGIPHQSNSQQGLRTLHAFAGRH